MRASELRPRPSSRTNFRRDRYRDVPARGGCYVLANFEEFVLYIGLAKSLRRRFEEHLDNQEKVLATKYGKAFWFCWLEAQELEALERGWMNHFEIAHAELPVLNKANSPLAI